MHGVAAVLSGSSNSATGCLVDGGTGGTNGTVRPGRLGDH